MHILVNKKTSRHTNSKPKNIHDRKNFVFQHVPVCDLKIVFQHRFSVYRKVVQVRFLFRALENQTVTKGGKYYGPFYFSKFGSNLPVKRRWVSHNRFFPFTRSQR